MISLTSVSIHGPIETVLCRLAALGAVFWLAGCAALPEGAVALPREAVRDYSIDARFTLRYDAKQYAGRLGWSHAKDHDELLLSSPFGQGMAEIVRDADGVRLTAADGQIHRAATAEALTREVLGYPLPVDDLADWLLGRGAGSRVERDPQGRPQRMWQGGWRIDYEYDNEDPQALPAQLAIERDGEREGIFALRLRVEEWRTAP